jgi:hypothetical protein
MTRGDEAVAAVVACPADHEHVAGAAGALGERHLGDGAAGALHQELAGDAERRDRVAVERAHRRGTDEGPNAVLPGRSAHDRSAVARGLRGRAAA